MIFKCKMCGGALVVQSNATVAVCEYCGTQQTLPRLNSERKTALYDRASHFRRSNDFDKAMAVYELLLNEDIHDAETYWSIVLCRYGIEYVEDPRTHKRIPTVNRAQYTSILADKDYKQAIANADAAQREVYEREAHAIDEIQKGILEISNKEDPFDVFICYKETEENGRRTPDSVYAQEIYNALTGAGYKVFFARITLEDKLGSAYEPYIFAALNSAKVMIALGTKPEYFNAVWVKNEWSRYLGLVQAGKGKTLIPAYKDMDPYDMPEEFAYLQSQDMGKLGYLQDLVRGVEKLIPKKSEEPTRESGSNTAQLIKRAFSLAEQGSWDKADICCEQLLNLDPENAQAYLVKLMVELRVNHQSELVKCAKPFDDRENYKKAIEYARPELVSELQGYIEQINARNEAERRKKEAAAKETARRTKKILSIAIPAVVACVAAFFLVTKLVIPTVKYNQAEKMLDAGNYDGATAAFTELADFRDSAVRADEAQYVKADAFLAAGDYESAATIFHKLGDTERCNQTYYEYGTLLMEAGEYAEAAKKFSYINDYKGANDLLLEAKYLEANAWLESGDYDEAIAAFKKLEDYKDSAERVKESENLRLYSKQVGDTLRFGDMTWKVLDRQEDRILVITQSILEKSPYMNPNSWSSKKGPACWKDSIIRSHYNQDYYLKSHFSEEERALILDTPIHTPDNHKYSGEGGPDTVDKLFLLSIDEVEKYFPTTEDRKNSSSVTEWWLRSPGNNKESVSYVDCTTGSISYIGMYARTENMGVRPAMWLDLSSLK